MATYTTSSTRLINSLGDNVWTTCPDCGGNPRTCPGCMTCGGSGVVANACNHEGNGDGCSLAQSPFHPTPLDHITSHGNFYSYGYGSALGL